MLHESLTTLIGRVLAQADPKSVPYRIGQALPCFFVLIGIIKCITISRRPATNAKSALGLACILFAMLVAMIGGVVAQEARADERHLIQLISCGVLYLFAAIGFVAGLIGLAQVTKRPDRFTQGIKQSIWAIGLAVVLFWVGALSFIVGASRVSRPSLFARALGTPQTTSHAVQSPLQQPVVPTGIQLVNENIRFDDPPAPWIPKVGKRIAPLTCLELQRANPEAYFIIICERHGVGSMMSSDLLIDGNIENMKRESQTLAVQAREPWVIDGIQGIRVNMRARRTAGRFSYVLWAGVKDGYSYRMITYGEERNEPVIHKEAEKLMSAFHLLDPTAIAHANTDTLPTTPSHYLATQPPAQVATNNRNAPAPQAPRQEAIGNIRRSRNFEYSITLENGWQDWPDAAGAAPSSDIGAAWGNDTCLVTIPIALGDLDADADVISSAVVRDWGMLFSNATNVKRNEVGVTQSCSFELDRTVEGTPYHYFARTIKRGRVAIVAIAWTSNPLRHRDLPVALSTLRLEGTNAPAFSMLEHRHKASHALIFNEIGLHYAEQNHHAQAVPWFERANQITPDDFQILDNLVSTQVEAQQLQQARLTVNTNLRRFPAQVPLRLRGAFIAAELGDIKAACDIYAEAFGSGRHRDDSSFRYYMMLLMKQERHDDALAAVEKYRRVSDAQPIVIMHSIICSRAGQHDRAINLLNTELKRNPKNSELAVALAGRYVDAERWDDAIKLVNEVRTRDGLSGPQEVDACYFLGRAETGLKHYREAKAAYEAGLKRSPNDKDCAEGLAYASALLGEGNNTAIKEPIDPVPLPAVSDLIAPTTQPSKKITDHFDAYYLFRARAISFVVGKEQRETEYRMIRVLNQRGVEMFSTMERQFDPLSQAIYVNKLEVRDASGKVIAVGKPSDCYIVDQPVKDSIVGNEKILHIPIPGLSPGCTIELITTIKELAPTKQIQHSSELLTYSLPVQRAALYLTGDIDHVRFVERNGPKAVRVSGGLLWTLDSPETYRYEHNQADISSYLPHVLLGDSTATWESEAKKYLEQIRGPLGPDASAAALANEIAAGATSRRAKCDAIVRQVQRDYTYKGIEFGRRARVPQNAGEIIRHRYGDCKDHALLAHQLLTAAGLKPHLVLVRTYDALDHAVPSLDQFDHMIVCVERAGGKFDYFDCTDKTSDLRVGVPANLAGKDVLVLDPAKPRIEQIPPYPAEFSSVSTNRNIQIDATGDVQASETLTCVGPWAGLMRSYLNSVAPNQRTQAVQSMLSGAGVELNVRELKFEHLEDTREPLVIEMKYSMRRRFAKVRQQLVGTVPSTWERYCLLPDNTTPRETPYRQRSPYRFEGQATVTLPDGLKLSELPPATETHRDPLTSGQVKYAASDRALTWQFALHVNAGQFSAPAYGEFVTNREKLVSGLEPSLVLEPGKTP